MVIVLILRQNGQTHNCNKEKNRFLYMNTHALHVTPLLRAIHQRLIFYGVLSRLILCGFRSLSDSEPKRKESKPVAKHLITS